MNEMKTKPEDVTLDNIIPAIAYVAFKEVKENPFKQKKTKAGLYLPDVSVNDDNKQGGKSTDEAEIMVGKVFAVGPNCKSIKPGDYIYTHRGLIYTFPINGEKVKVTMEGNIMLCINDKDVIDERKLQNI